MSIVHHCDWKDLPVESCDLLCVDAPYSEKTHKGHDDGSRLTSDPVQQPEIRDNLRRASMGLAPIRRSLNYGYWTKRDVAAFVRYWHPRTRGWMVSLTDHVLAATWADAMRACNRYVFAPIACVEVGSRVRMCGDGPSNWTVWAIASRPRSTGFAKWGALPGAYVLPPGARDAERKQVVGGKPLWLMERLVEDYSRPGDLVVDPCCGAATTGIAALRHGRRFIGGDAMAEHVTLAREAIAAELELSTVSARKAGQVSLFGEVANG